MFLLLSAFHSWQTKRKQKDCIIISTVSVIFWHGCGIHLYGVDNAFPCVSTILWCIRCGIFTLHYLNLFTKTYHRLTIHKERHIHFIYFSHIKTLISQTHCSLDPVCLQQTFSSFHFPPFHHPPHMKNRNRLVVLPSILNLIYFVTHPDHTISFFSLWTITFYFCSI